MSLGWLFSLGWTPSNYIGSNTISSSKVNSRGNNRAELCASLEHAEVRKHGGWNSSTYVLDVKSIPDELCYPFLVSCAYNPLLQQQILDFARRFIL